MGRSKSTSTHLAGMAPTILGSNPMLEGGLRLLLAALKKAWAKVKGQRKPVFPGRG